MRFRLVDVFAEAPLAGNGLAVFFGGIAQPAADLLALTREMRQFESVFVEAADDGEDAVVDARVFSLAAELAFAGHPLLGAAAALHDNLAETEAMRRWMFRLGPRRVPIESGRKENRYVVSMDQGQPSFGPSPDPELRRALVAALSLEESDLAHEPQVVSTGLRYLIVPVSAGLERSRIVDPGFEALLHRAGAEFVYVVDVVAREGRHWENDGSIEDIATGSAAGPAGAFLVRNGLARANETIVIRQGRWLGRPSAISVRVDGDRDAIDRVEIAGPVSMVARGELD